MALREGLTVNGVRILAVELSRLLDPRENGSLPARFAEKDDGPAALKAAGQVVEKTMRLVEEVAADLKRLAHATELSALIAFDKGHYAIGGEEAYAVRTRIVNLGREVIGGE